MWSATPRCTTRAPVRPSFSRLREIVRHASRSDSTNVADAAPRESASSPIAPEPAKRSSTVASSTGPIKLKAASRTRSPVGRVSIPLGAKIRAPLREPAMIRIGEQLLDVVVQRAFVVDQLLGFGAGLFEKSSVRSQARELELGQARLAGAEQLAFASDLEVLLRKLEPVRRV